MRPRTAPESSPGVTAASAASQSSSTPPTVQRTASSSRQLHRECRRRHLVLNRPEHPADGRDPGQVAGGRLVDIRAELVGQGRVEQMDQLVVGEAPRGRLRHGAAEPVHDAVAQRLQLLLDGVLPALVRLAHFGQRYPLAGSAWSLVSCCQPRQRRTHRVERRADRRQPDRQRPVRPRSSGSSRTPPCTSRSTARACWRRPRIPAAGSARGHVRDGHGPGAVG